MASNLPTDPLSVPTSIDAGMAGRRHAARIAHRAIVV